MDRGTTALLDCQPALSLPRPAGTGGALHRTGFNQPQVMLDPSRDQMLALRVASLVTTQSLSLSTRDIKEAARQAVGEQARIAPIDQLLRLTEARPDTEFDKCSVRLAGLRGEVYQAASFQVVLAEGAETRVSALTKAFRTMSTEERAAFVLRALAADGLEERDPLRFERARAKIESLVESPEKAAAYIARMEKSVLSRTEHSQKTAVAVAEVLDKTEALKGTSFFARLKEVLAEIPRVEGEVRVHAERVMVERVSRAVEQHLSDRIGVLARAPAGRISGGGGISEEQFLAIDDLSRLRGSRSTELESPLGSMRSLLSIEDRELAPGSKAAHRALVASVTLLAEARRVEGVQRREATREEDSIKEAVLARARRLIALELKHPRDSAVIMSLLDRSFKFHQNPFAEVPETTLAAAA